MAVKSLSQLAREQRSGVRSLADLNLEAAAETAYGGRDPIFGRQVPVRLPPGNFPMRGWFLDERDKEVFGQWNEFPGTIRGMHTRPDAEGKLEVFYSLDLGLPPEIATLDKDLVQQALFGEKLTPATAAERVRMNYRNGQIQVQLADLGMAVLEGRDTPATWGEIERLRKALGTDFAAALRPWWEKMATATAEQLPMMGEGMKEAPFGAGIGMAIGGGVAMAASAASPTIGEETMIPAAAWSGAKIGGGVAMAWRVGQLEAGSAVLDLLDMGIDPRIAKATALGIGAFNGFLETTQAGTLLKTLPGGKSLASRGISEVVNRLVKKGTLRNLAAQHVTRYGTYLGAETLQELGQESVNIVGEEFDKWLHEQYRGVEIDPATLAEIVARYREVGGKSLAAFSVLGVPGTAVSAAVDVYGLKAGHSNAVDRMMPDGRATEVVAWSPEIAAKEAGQGEAKSEIADPTTERSDSDVSKPEGPGVVSGVGEGEGEGAAEGKGPQGPQGQKGQTQGEMGLTGVDASGGVGKKAWEMTKSEWEGTYLFHGTTRQLSEIQPNSYYADYDYARLHAFDRMKKENGDTRKVYAVKRSDLQPISPPEDDVFGQGLVNTGKGSVVYSGAMHRGVEVPDGGHKEIVRRAVRDGQPVPRAVLEDYKGEPWADAALAKLTESATLPGMKKNEGAGKPRVRVEAPKELLAAELSQESVASLVAKAKQIGVKVRGKKAQMAALIADAIKAKAGAAKKTRMERDELKATEKAIREHPVYQAMLEASEFEGAGVDVGLEGRTVRGRVNPDRTYFIEERYRSEVENLTGKPFTKGYNKRLADRITYDKAKGQAWDDAAAEQALDLDLSSFLDSLAAAVASSVPDKSGIYAWALDKAMESEDPSLQMLVEKRRLLEAGASGYDINEALHRIAAGYGIDKEQYGSLLVGEDMPVNPDDPHPGSMTYEQFHQRLGQELADRKSAWMQRWGASVPEKPKAMWQRLKAEWEALAAARITEELTLGDLVETPAPQEGGKGPWGSGNRRVTREQYEAIKAKRAGGKLAGGRQAGGTILFDPEEWADLVKLAAFHVEAGARTLAEWSAKMVADLGEEIKPHLEDLWQAVRPSAADEKGKPLTAKQRKELEALDVERVATDVLKKQKDLVVGRLIAGTLDEAAEVRSLRAGLVRAWQAGRKSGIEQARAAYAAAKQKARANQRLRDHVGWLLRYIKKPAGGTLAMEARRAITLIQAGIDPHFRRKSTIDTRQASREYFAKHPDVWVAPKVLERIQARSPSEMTVAELEEVARSVRELRHKGRLLKHQADEARAQRLADDKTEFLRAIGREGWSPEDSGPITRAEKEPLGRRIRNLVDHTLTPERLFDAIEGGKDFAGRVFRMMWDTVADATDSKLRMTKSRRDAVEAKLKELGLTLADLVKPAITVGGREYSGQEVIGVYNFMRNPLSRLAITFGNRIALADQTRIARFVEDEAPALQDLADWMIEFYDARYEVMRQVTIDAFGADPGREENYTPMRRMEVDFVPDERQIRQELEARFHLKQAFVEHGFAIHRKDVPAEHQKPIRLDAVSLLFEQIEREEHEIAFAGLVKRMNELVHDSEVKAAVMDKVGRSGWQRMKNYVDAVANPNIYRTYHDLERLAQTLRGHAAIAFLAGKLSTMLLQPVSVMLYLPEAGHHLFISAAKTATDWDAVRSFVTGKDALMEAPVLEREFQELRDKDPAVKSAVKAVGEWMMKPLSWFDMVGRTIGWYGTYLHQYERLVREGKGEEQAEAEAARIARHTTTRTQPGARAFEMAEMYRTSAWINLIQQFTQQLNRMWNMTAYDMPRAVRNGQYQRAVAIFAALGINGVLTWAVQNGRLPEDDDDLKEAFGEQFISSIPFIGTAWMAYERGYESGAVPAVSGAAKLAANVVDAGKALVKGDVDEKALVKALEGLAPVLGIPWAGPKRIVEAVRTGNPWELLGKPKKKKKGKGK